MNCYYGIWDLEHYQLIIARVDEGLCYVDMNPKGVDGLSSFAAWCKKHRLTPMNGESKLLNDFDALKEYLDGKRNKWDTPLFLFGTDFQKEVWQALLSIPYGETKTYSDIAHQINRPKAIRAVARAIGQNPLMFIVPCHRVIGKDGSLTGFSGGLALKQYLLTIEKTS